MLGLCDKIYRSLEAAYPRARVWLSTINVAFQPQHGGQLAGNECRRILKNSESLKRFALEDGELEVVQPYVDLMDSLNSVILACFGNELEDDYEEKIKVFTSKFRSMNISKRMTKAHILDQHVIPFLKTKGRGLGFYNESSLEASHYDFLQFWRRHQVKAKDSEMAKRNLLKSVLEYNTLHT